MADRPAGPPARRWTRAGQAVASAALLLLVGLPLAELGRTALGDGVPGLRRALAGSGRPLWDTAWTASVATVAAVAAGAAAAVVTERSAAPGRRLLRAGLVSSLLSAPLVSALGWARAYGPAGLADHLFGLRWAGLFGPVGIVAVIAAGAVPLTYLVVAAGLSARAEPDLERAARASGASAPRALGTVTLPLARPALAAATALAFVAAVNAFEIPAVLGIPANFPTVTTRLYQDLTLSADPASFTAAAVLAVLLVLVSVAVVGPTDWRLGGRPAAREAGPTGQRQPADRGCWGLTAGLGGFLALTTAVPLTALVLVSLTRGDGVAPWPSNWTLRNFQTALNGHVGAALGHSVLLAVAAATGAVLLGGLTVALGRRGAGRALGSAVTMTFAVAGSALAVAVLLAYGRFLRDSLLIILVAYLAKFWALGHRPLAGAVEGLPAELTLAGRASGAGPVTAARTVVAPLLRPALTVGWLLVFLFAIHELTISSLLYGPGSQTLAVAILNLQQVGDVTVTSALSVLLTVIVAAAAAMVLMAPRVWARRLGRA